MFKTKKRRGAGFSTDMAIAIFIFLTLFISITIAWNSVLGSSSQNIQRKHVEMMALRIVDEFVRTGGYPSDWEDNPLSALTIGLAESDRVLDVDKVQVFIDMDNETAKGILKTEGYDFQLRLVNSGITKGSEPDSDNIFFTRRVVLYNGANETLELYLWRAT